MNGVQDFAPLTRLREGVRECENDVNEVYSERRAVQAALSERKRETGSSSIPIIKETEPAVMKRYSNLGENVDEGFRGSGPNLTAELSIT